MPRRFLFISFLLGFCESPAAKMLIRRMVLGCPTQNLHWKLGRLTPSFGSILAVWLKKIFLGIRLFVFQDRKLILSASVWNWISWNLAKFQLNQTTDKKRDENNNCLNKLNELKFCEVSRNSISNWTWKFQRSILKNKKVLFLRKIFFRPYYQVRSKRWR